MENPVRAPMIYLSLMSHSDMPLQQNESNLSSPLSSIVHDEKSINTIEQQQRALTAR